MKRIAMKEAFDRFVAADVMRPHDWIMFPKLLNDWSAKGRVKLTDKRGRSLTQVGDPEETFLDSAFLQRLTSVKPGGIGVEVIGGGDVSISRTEISGFDVGVRSTEAEGVKIDKSKLTGKL
ncbi:MAG: hypothetical protein R3E02_08065 [Blastomonas sp.]